MNFPTDTPASALAAQRGFPLMRALSTLPFPFCTLSTNHYSRTAPTPRPYRHLSHPTPSSQPSPQVAPSTPSPSLSTKQIISCLCLSPGYSPIHHRVLGTYVTAQPKQTLHITYMNVLPSLPLPINSVLPILFKRFRIRINFVQVQDGKKMSCPTNAQADPSSSLPPHTLQRPEVNKDCFQAAFGKRTFDQSSSPVSFSRASFLLPEGRSKKYKYNWALFDSLNTTVQEKFTAKWGALFRRHRQGDAPAADAKGVIYALLENNGDPVYIGQTESTVRERVKGHYSQSTCDSNFLPSTASAEERPMRSLIQHATNTRGAPFFYIALETIPSSHYTPKTSTFYRAACNRERFYINLLHRTAANLSLNTAGRNGRLSKRKRKRKKPRPLPAQRHNTPRPPPPALPQVVNHDGHVYLVCDPACNQHTGMVSKLNDLLALPLSTLKEYNVSTWTRTRAIKTVKFLRSFFFKENFTEAVQCLEQMLSKRTADPELSKVNRDTVAHPWLKVNFCHKSMDMAKLGRVLRDPAVLAHCSNPSLLKATRLCFKHRPLASHSLLSFVQEGLNYDGHPPPLEDASKCACLKYANEHTHLYKGHVVGSALDLPSSPKLKQLFEMGLKFRLPSHRAFVFEELQDSIAALCGRHFPDDTSLPTALFNAANTHCFKSTLSPLFPDRYPFKKVAQELDTFAESLCIVKIDKSNHDYGFICRSTYLQEMHAFLQGSCFSRIPDPSTILATITHTNTTLGFKTPPLASYMYGLVKLHKSTPSMRWITGLTKKNEVTLPGSTPSAPPLSPPTSPPPPQQPQENMLSQDTLDSESDLPPPPPTTARTFSTSASGSTHPYMRSHPSSKKTKSIVSDAHVLLSLMLKKVMKTLKEKDTGAPPVAGHTVRRYWIVDSAEEFALHLKTNFSEYKSLLPATFDFKEMYNALRHDSIVSGVKRAVEEAFAHAGKPSMVLTPLGVEFSTLEPSPSPPDSFSFSLLSDKVALSPGDVVTLLSFVLQNAVVKQGSHFFRQTKGIPMGGNASPDIANLYCYSVEAAYVDAMVQAGEWEVVAACRRITRYIDDFLCFGSTPPPAKLYGMAYSCTSSPIPINYVIDLDYIGLRLRLELGEVAAKNWVRMGVANKARKWNFRPVRFPHAGSVAPLSQGAGVFKGLCIRAICLCNNSNDLLLELVRTVYDMLDRGHLEKSLTTAFHVFLQERMTTAPFDRDMLLRSFKHIVGAYKRQEKCEDVVTDAWFVGPAEPCGDTQSACPPVITLPLPPTITSAIKRSATDLDDLTPPPSTKRRGHVRFTLADTGEIVTPGPVVPRHISEPSPLVTPSPTSSVPPLSPHTSPVLSPAPRPALADEVPTATLTSPSPAPTPHTALVAADFTSPSPSPAPTPRTAFVAADFTSPAPSVTSPSPAPTPRTALVTAVAASLFPSPPSSPALAPRTLTSPAPSPPSPSPTVDPTPRTAIVDAVAKELEPHPSPTPLPETTERPDDPVPVTSSSLLDTPHRNTHHTKFSGKALKPRLKLAPSALQKKGAKKGEVGTQALRPLVCLDACHLSLHMGPKELQLEKQRARAHTHTHPAPPAARTKASRKPPASKATSNTPSSPAPPVVNTKASRKQAASKATPYTTPSSPAPPVHTQASQKQAASKAIPPTPSSPAPPVHTQASQKQAASKAIPPTPSSPAPPVHTQASQKQAASKAIPPTPSSPAPPVHTQASQKQAASKAIPPTPSPPTPPIVRTHASQKQAAGKAIPSTPSSPAPPVVRTSGESPAPSASSVPRSLHLSRNVTVSADEGGLTLSGIPRPAGVYYCALSAVLQAFRIVTPLLSLQTHSLPCLQPLFSLPDLNKNDRMAFIVSLWERLGYKPDKQEDAADVLENVLDTCFADSARDQVNSTFAFSVLSVATCPALHHTCESVPHDVWGSPRILRLPLAPFKQGDSLFTSENTADVCKTCRRRRPADTLKMSFKLMRGDVLCAAVSRSRSAGKDATPFYPPLHISTPFGREYVLRYQCAHQGVSSTSGHWVGFVYSRNRNRGPIVKIDDGVVAPVAPNDADLSQGVLFFYERIPSLAYTPLKISQYFATQTADQGCPSGWSPKHSWSFVAPPWCIPWCMV